MVCSGHLHLVYIFSVYLLLHQQCIVYYTLDADLCPRHTVVMLVGLTNMLTLCYSTFRVTIPIQIHPVEYTRIRCVLLLSNIIEGNLMGLTLDSTWLLPL